ncbi:MAG: TraB/GumN family protein [Caulobacterales bacterium]
MRPLRSVFLILIFGLAFTSPACAPRPPEPALWKISDHNSEIWLFGTVHVLPPSLAWRRSHVDAAFARADIVVFEADVSPELRPAFDAFVRAEGALPETEQLSDRLAPETREQLLRVARQLGMDSAQLERVRPWLAALQLSLAYALRQGGDPDIGVDTVLGRAARAQNKRIDYLEAATDQIRAISTLSPEGEARFLKATLSQIEDDGGRSDALNRAWSEGDVRTLGRLLDDMSTEAGPEARSAIITRRNEAWTQRIQDMLAGEGRIFIAVGAAHLSGEGNVVALLRARGVHVEGP